MKKIIAMICIMVIVLTTAIMFVGCDKKSEDLSKKPLKSPGSGYDPAPPWYLRYKAPKSIFAIDDVRLTVSCGGHFTELCEAEEIYVSSYGLSEDWEKIENKSELFANPDYEYCARNLIGINVWVSNISVHYEEELVLPKELFTHDKGIIIFKFMALNNYPYIRNYPYEARDYGGDVIVVDPTFDTGAEPEEFASESVFYEVHKDMVILDSDWFSYRREK